MGKTSKDLLVGTGLGMVLVVVIEVARYFLPGDRSLAGMAWTTLWGVSFAAFMWSVSRSDEPNTVRGPKDRSLAERRADARPEQPRNPGS